MSLAPVAVSLRAASLIATTSSCLPGSCKSGKPPSAWRARNQASAGAFGGPKPIERQVHADAAQPGSHLAVRSCLEVWFVCEFEECLLQRVFRFHAIADNSVHQTE